MCHTVHMKTISIRELHLETGRRVREASAGGAIVITDRGRPIATIQPLGPDLGGRPLPDREKRIRKRSRLPVDSAVVVSEMRDRP